VQDFFEQLSAIPISFRKARVPEGLAAPSKIGPVFDRPTYKIF
jgi:hypothetical protein